MIDLKTGADHNACGHYSKMADGSTQKNKSGLEALQKCSRDQANKVIHELIDLICGGRQPSSQSYGDLWTAEEWQTLTRQGSESLKQFISRGLTKDETLKELDTTPLSSEMRQTVVDCLSPRKEEIRQSLVRSTAAISQAHLKDFDWKVKLIMSSDKLSSIREPVAAVDFHIKQGEEEKQVSLELTKEQLKNVVSSLEAANKVVIQLKG